MNILSLSDITGYTALIKAKADDPSCKGDISNELVVGPCSTLFDKNSCCGWLWTIYNPDGLTPIVKSIEDSYQTHLTQIQPILENYNKTLIQACQGKKVNEQALDTLRHKIILFNNAFLYLHTSNPKIVAFLKKHLGKEAFQDETLTICRKYDAVFRVETAKIGLGGCGNVGTLPYPLLAKVGRGINLSSSEQEELKALAARIDDTNSSNTASTYVTPDHLCVAFTAIAERSSNEDPTKAINRIFQALIKQGLKRILAQSESHTKWRNALQEGDEVTINGKGHKLGTQEPIEYSEDVLRKFDHASLEGYEVVIASNQMHLRVIKYTADCFNASSPIPKVTFEEVDSEGRAALISKTKSLKEISWGNTNESNEKIHYESCITLLKKLKGYVGHTIHVSLEDLVVDSEGNIKLKAESQKVKDWILTFEKLELLAFTLSQGDASIYSSLMKESELSSHAGASFYQEVAKQAFQGILKEDKIEELSLLRKVKSSLIIETARVVWEKCNAVRNACLQKVSLYRKEFDMKLTEADMKLVGEKLTNAFSDLHTASLLGSDKGSTLLKKLEETAAKAILEAVQKPKEQTKDKSEEQTSSKEEGLLSFAYSAFTSWIDSI